MHNLDYFFKAKTVAVIGANREEGKIGNSIFRNFFGKKFKGKAYPVNHKADEVLGRKCFKSVKDIPGSVDMAVIVTPVNTVKNVMLECAEKKVKTAVVVTSGFGEVGKKAFEYDIKSVSDKAKMRVIGPNCLGVFDAFTGVDTLFLPEKKLGRPRKGSISFISQSGAVGSVVLDWMALKGYGVSKFISYGNAMDVDESDLLEYLGEDKATKVICVYLEGVKNGRRFMQSAKKVSEKKPVIVLKGGRTEAGSKAVSSHTGSLAGADAVYDAAFKQSGVIRAKHIIEMFNFARTLSEQPLPKGNRIAVITNGGGFGVLAADQVVLKRLKLADFTDGTKKALSAAVPSYGGISNPVDLVGDADDERYKKALGSLEKDKNVDAIMCILLFQTAPITPKAVDYVIDFARRSSKPIVVCSAGGRYTEEMAKKLEESDIPVFDDPARAVDALDALVDYAHIKKGMHWTYD